MKVVLHVCCGPCTTYPLQVLREEGIAVHGFFHNPNIHPFREFRKRLGAMRRLAETRKMKVEYRADYGLKEFLREVVFKEEQRCGICYAMRLQATVAYAKEIGADAFSTTLLYSRYQKHALIRSTAETLAAQSGVPFYYQDFRKGWQQGIDMAIEAELYRQSYCGCIYSEQERYDKKMRKNQLSVDSRQ